MPRAASYTRSRPIMRLMRLSALRSGCGALSVAAIALVFAWMAAEFLPVPWNCDTPAVSASSDGERNPHAIRPQAAALNQAILAACRAGTPTVEIDLSRLWAEPWSRLELFFPYHGNFEVIRRIGFDPEVMACTRSRFYDEWTQAVLQGEKGVIALFDLPTVRLPPAIRRSKAVTRDNPVVRMTCPVSP